MNLNNLTANLKRPSYRTYWTKMGTHMRLISAPNESMEELHQRFIRYLREHGALKIWLHYSSADTGRGWVENAKKVRFCRYFYKTDISSAFESIRLDQLAWALKSTIAGIGETEGTFDFEWDANVADFLERWCMNDPKQGSTGLRRGPNSSPLLTEILFSLLFDHPIEAAIRAQSSPIWCARYVDDFVLGMIRQEPGVWKFLHRQIRNCGFRVNHQKTHILDIERHPVVITGVGIQSGGRLYIPRKTVERAHGLMHRMILGLPTEVIGENGAPKDPHQVIKGTMEAFYLVTNESGKPYNMTENKLHWLYDIYKLMRLLRSSSRRRVIAPGVRDTLNEGLDRVSHLTEGNAVELAQLQKLHAEFERRYSGKPRRHAKTLVRKQEP